MKRTQCSLMALALALASLVFPRSAAAQTNVLITEIMAANTRTLADEDNDFEDWVEIYNAGTNTVNLDGWYLADSGSSWRFPETNLAPNSFLIVFASNKDRRIPGRQLHTNFRLERNGESLRLLYPDGVTVASGYAPGYPIQASDVGYGLPVVQTPVTLVSTGAPAKLLVPADGTLGASWAQPDFNDAAWTAVSNGIGFETEAAAAFAPVILADSAAEFSGTQGGNNWFYGYWNKTADADGMYNAMTDYVPFPRGASAALSATNYWDGTRWDWPAGNPPWTELTNTGGHPSGDNGDPFSTNHWTIRRWVCEASGPLRITGTLACNSQDGTCGDGTVGRILIDGAEVFQRTVFGTSVGYSVIVNANAGSLIDFVIDAGADSNDFCDSTTFTAVIRTAGESAVVADSFVDWSDSGVQGAGGWSYGYWIKTNAAATYTSAQYKSFPSGTGPHSTGNFWDGAQWKWFDGDPPYDTLGQIVCRPSLNPSGGTNALEHWVIRRWVSEISGTVTIDWHFAKKELTGSGTIAKVFRNGAQIDTLTLTASDFAGSTRTIAPFAVQAGDAIDFTVEPGVGTPANTSIGDTCFLNATISGSTTLSNQFASDVGAAMRNVNATAYLRIPFTVTNLLGFDTLTLRMKYDDGLIVYLNGSPVASRNAPESPVWNVTATASRLDAQASQFEELSLTAVRDLLRVGTNVLALHGMNASAADADFLAAAELRATMVTIDAATPNYFASPTPGSLNGAGTTNLGPLVLDVTHTPHDPADDQDLVVTARIVQTFNPVSTVRLYYRVQFGSESNVVMLDDGLHGDGLAGDGTYGATVPNSISAIGQMVRYYITATDSRSNFLREPPFPNPTFSAQYLGAVVRHPALTNPLPVLHLFIPDATLTSAGNDSVGRYPCSLYFLGEFYDNVGINRHGQSSAGFPKKSFDIDFNPDHHFLWKAGEKRVDDINLLTTYPDKAHMRNMLAYETLRDAGSPYHYVVPIRIQTNGGFYGDWHLVENGDSDYLKRIGRDPNGALYKMYNTFNDAVTTPDYTLSSSEAEKKTRKYEGNADLIALFNGVNSASLSVRTNYMYDNVNVAEVINTFAARSVTSDWDCCHKNYYVYRDSDGTGEWEALPWDIDLSFGRNWSSSQTYWDDTVYPGNRAWGNWNNNGFFQVVLNIDSGGGRSRGIEATRQMYFRRLRTLMDEIMQTNGTPAAQLRYEKRADELTAMLAPDAALDLAKWGTWGGGATGITDTNNQYWRTLSQSVAQLKTNYLPARRTYIFNQFMGLTGDDLINFTNAQPTNVVILFGALDYNPSSGNQAQEYLQLRNTNRIAVDISGWKLSGAIEHTFQGGVVIPSSNSVYVVPDKKAFRSRSLAPRGGMGLYVEGAYQGQLSARGEAIILTDKYGNSRTNTYTGNPTPAQSNLRITELMFHPGRTLGAAPGTEEEYEYIEFKNIGSTNLDLTGVHFVTGVEFSFTGSAVTSLAPGQSVLVVKNMAAFAARYGGGFNVAGQYLGSLDNAGENLRLDDAVGEKVLDFKYDNKWYPITDGAGPSLVIVNENASWTTWDLKSNWRPSGYDTGSPGTNDPPLAGVSPILVSEVLTHSDVPFVDTIELYNPNTNDVSLLDWYLSDDFVTPKKFRVTNNVVVPAGGYVTFDENDFNVDPGNPVRFSFSSRGDEAYVFSGDTNGNLTGWFHGYSFGAAETGVSFGRFITSTGGVHFVAQSATTFGAANAFPKVGPVAITEIMYHPPDQAGGIDNQDHEYLELFNLTGAPLPLFDPDHHTNTWRLRGGVDFDFPTNQTLGSNGYALVVNFDPRDTAKLASFRDVYGVSSNVPIFGPYSSKLDNGRQTVRLSQPDAPEAGEVPYVLVEEVEYVDSDPWPLPADGFGPSLVRRSANGYGNEATNWIAAAATPGGPSGSGTPPVITQQPASQTVVGGTTAMLSVGATGTGPFRYQWLTNGNTLPGAVNSILSLPNVQLSQSGQYQVIVQNSAGAVASSNAMLTVLAPIVITAQPQEIRVRPGTNAATATNVVFSVGAMSSSAIRYQWRFNGQNIQWGTNASLTVTNVQPPDDGLYSVVVSDIISSATSVSVRLVVLVDPFFIQHPLNQTVVEGDNATFTVVVGGTLPMGFRWRKNGQPFVAFGIGTNTLTISNVTFAANNSNRYECVATNYARSGGNISSNGFLFVALDTDGDHLPDFWEMAYGTDLNNPADAMMDPDEDGVSNRDEYLAGTDPNDRLSYLKIDSITATNSATLTFFAQTNRSYTVLFRDVVSTGQWQKLADVMARPSARVETVVDAAPNTNRFYKLQVPVLQP